MNKKSKNWTITATFSLEGNEGTVKAEVRGPAFAAEAAMKTFATKFSNSRPDVKELTVTCVAADGTKLTPIRIGEEWWSIGMSNPGEKPGTTELWQPKDAKPFRGTEKEALALAQKMCDEHNHIPQGTIGISFTPVVKKARVLVVHEGGKKT